MGLYIQALVIGCFALIVVSCSQQETHQSITNNKDASLVSKNEHDSCTHYLKECRALDSTLLKSIEYNEQLAIKANNTFVKYALLCNNDSLSPEYLLKAAQLSQTLNKINMSEKYLMKILENYPSSKIIPAAKFLLAQYYADVHLLNQPQKARELLNSIIKEYPHTIWAENATAALQWLGKTDEEILKEIKKKSK